MIIIGYEINKVSLNWLTLHTNGSKWGPLDSIWQSTAPILIRRVWNPSGQANEDIHHVDLDIRWSLIPSANYAIPYMPSLRNMGNAAVGHIHRHQGKGERLQYIAQYRTYYCAEQAGIFGGGG